MRKHDDILMDLIEAAGSSFIRTLVISLRWRVIDGYKDYVYHREYPGVIWAFWHSQLIFPAFIGRDRGARILISRHRDGEIIARVGRGLGIQAVRGSTSRDGIEGLVALSKVPMRYDLAVAPDGPRGPREIVQPGVIYLAQATGRAIVPLMCTAWPCVRLKSWDRFIVPLPFSFMSAAIGNAITVPPDASAALREERRQQLEAEMKRVTALVERTARELHPTRRYAKHHHAYCPYDLPFATKAVDNPDA